MATAHQVYISPNSDVGVFSCAPKEDTARVASEALQEDMLKHHVFFNQQGFHNHIPHSLLSIYAVGGSPDDIEAAYKRNASYQRPVLPTDNGVVEKMRQTGNLREHFGKEKHYPNFLSFFQKEIDEKGVDTVLNIYLFAENDQAQNLFCRLWGGLVHPLIHLGFGLEFKQPAIVAEALAQASVHEDKLGYEFFLLAEKQAGDAGKAGSKTLMQLLDEIRTNKTLSTSARYSDKNKIFDGVLGRASQEMLRYASQYTVSPDQVDEKLADMMNTVVYYTAAAQRPNKAIKLDFFFLHCVNSAIFFSRLICLPGASQRTRLRLLEWKGRLDLLMYVSRGCPELRKEDILNHPATKDWSAVFASAASHPKDDGHLVKFVRAVAHAEQVCKPYEDQDRESMPVKGKMWLQIANMAVDSTVGAEDSAMWVRSTGFEEAWENVAGRSRL
ncbi:Oxidoreductase ptaJ [Penicillium diatomitis]|uniref:Oxidoreductase ptaJ n=1 Tax=Penicillium diatomitis TaxID=2819901 RepID=A0A9W9XLK3_9EURO|nr:Oxidoreductase ptaJ [Penicillium diatomitis]KAJ5495276.1 Oxidoreductase ptaJ [Penicillium diatomitis]